MTRSTLSQRYRYDDIRDRSRECRAVLHIRNQERHIEITSQAAQWLTEIIFLTISRPE